MSDAPERIDVLLSARGDMAINSRGEPLNGGKGDTHITYIRADLVRALPAVQHHVNEPPKSEHVPDDVLTPATKEGA